MIQQLLSAPVTIALLATNILISIAAFNDPRLLDRALFHVDAMRHRGEWYRMITSGFIHANPTHLFMNMITLFFFGPALEVALGSQSFATIYLASLVGGSAWALMENYRNLEYRALGASGAISGVTVAYAMFAPFALLFVFFIPMPAIVFAVVYILFSAYASGSGRNDGIGHGAHLGGALTGLVLVCIFWPLAIRALWDDLLRLFTGA